VACKLSVLIPVYNEVGLVESAVQTARGTLERTGVSWEIILVDDGSSDGTAAKCRELCGGDSRRIRLVVHPRNRGLGAAYRTGMDVAVGEFCINLGADIELTPPALDSFMSLADRHDLVLGWRSERSGYTFLMRFNTWFYHSLVRALFGVPYRDLNWIHFYRRSAVAGSLTRANGIVMMAESVVAAKRRGLRIGEVRCDMKPRAAGDPSAGQFRVMLQAALELAVFCLRSLFPGKTGLSGECMERC